MRFFSAIIRAVLASVTLATLVGCAHPINIGGDTRPERIESELIQKKVAYAISETQRNTAFVSPVGGGDSVRYFPYRDLEKTIRDALRSVYQDVTLIAAPSDTQAVEAARAALIFIPEIKTDSGSSSVLTWPPTYFVTEIACVVTDANGNEIGRVKASARGEAEFSEFLDDFGLAAKRAATQVAQQLSSEIRKNEKLR